MTRIDEIGKAIPDPSVGEILEKSISKINDIITLARSLVPISTDTDRILKKNVPKQYTALRAFIEATELLQETIEDFDVLQARRQETGGDLDTLTDRAVSVSFVVQNLNHDVIIQYLIEEKAKSGELAAIVAGLNDEAKDKLAELLRGAE